MLEINKIALSENLELPYICDLNVLGQLQKKYGTIEEFERRIVNFNDKKKYKEPDALAVLTGLDLMVQEGMKIDREENNAVHPVSSLNEIHYKTERDYRSIAKDIHRELERCFKVKK